MNLNPFDNTRKAHEGITHWSKGAMIPYSGNFTNWVQYRQLIPNHDCKRYEPTERKAILSVPHYNC